VLTVRLSRRGGRFTLLEGEILKVIQLSSIKIVGIVGENKGQWENHSKKLASMVFSLSRHGVCR
jgi:hypothetical protein